MRRAGEDGIDEDVGHYRLTFFSESRRFRRAPSFTSEGIKLRPTPIQQFRRSSLCVIWRKAARRRAHGSSFNFLVIPLAQDGSQLTRGKTHEGHI